MQEEYIDLVWDKHPDYIRKFHKNKISYAILCDEIEFILHRIIEEEKIEIASISTRVKSEASFCEKIYRKSYDNPFDEITDFAGARIVYLYSSDKKPLESVIEKNFEIIEKIDKIDHSETEKFGYGALHYLVKLKPDYLKARYKDLEDFICEIQIRTILQDAWAVVAHHLSYKQESDIPKHLRRKLNALSGLFETADDQFESIRILRSEYHKKVNEKIKRKNIKNIDIELNNDNLSTYLNIHFPERNKAESAISELLYELKEFNLDTLMKLDNILTHALDAAIAYEEKYPPIDQGSSIKTRFNQIGIMRVILAFSDDDYSNVFFQDIESKARKEEFTHLLK